MNSKISDKDKEDWESFLSNKESLPDKDNKLSKKKLKSLRFDLHGYSLEEANTKIKYLINKSYENGINKLTIVTGKGLHSDNEKDPYVSKDLSILKYSVPEYIQNSDELISKINDIHDANIEDGGSGAFYIYIKKKPIK
ncbi:Smr/MutS family protein [Candidatus Pelagibacter sp.]|nr:Smr/MutS family protein [Candidatus Pelagibacter sp.]